MALQGHPDLASVVTVPWVASQATIKDTVVLASPRRVAIDMWVILAAAMRTIFAFFQPSGGYESSKKTIEIKIVRKATRIQKRDLL